MIKGVGGQILWVDMTKGVVEKKPIDEELILESVKKTGKLVVVDGGWKTCGISAEISALIAEKGFQYLKSPVKRITLPEAPAPASHELEDEYYLTYSDIINTIKAL